jgi:hypothetical protein
MAVAVKQCEAELNKVGWSGKKSGRYSDAKYRLTTVVE